MHHRDSLIQWWHGRRDGRRGLPSVAPDSDVVDVSPTPHDRTLIQRRDEVAQRELQRLIERSDSTCQKIAEYCKQIQQTENSLQQRLAELRTAEQPPSEADLRRRGPSEEEFEEEVIRRRRSAEFGKQLVPLRAAIAELHGLLDTLNIQRAGLEARITNDLRKAQSRGSQYVSFTEILRAKYWRALVRAHQERNRLIAVVPPTAPAPAWISTADYRTVLGVKLPSADIEAPGREHPSPRASSRLRRAVEPRASLYLIASCCPMSIALSRRDVATMLRRRTTSKGRLR
ncbi:hypothetical protein [Nocardia brasiliensis]|uniref:hypothetical protein n=1 Tax=Nocardia brasiliensis TaxID=37326 RepID=UPI00245757D4|nr:hypothetical protein [Nocardia brasiliensis]